MRFCPDAPSNCILINYRLKEWCPGFSSRPHSQEFRQVVHVFITKTKDVYLTNVRNAFFFSNDSNPEKLCVLMRNFLFSNKKKASVWIGRRTSRKRPPRMPRALTNCKREAKLGRVKWCKDFWGRYGGSTSQLLANIFFPFSNNSPRNLSGPVSSFFPKW